MSNDLINGLFESIGGILIWLNVVSILKDKEVKGVNLWASLFYSIWAVWSLFYYGALSQWWSLIGDAVILGGNVIWLWLAIRYKYFPEEKSPLVL